MQHESLKSLNSRLYKNNINYRNFSDELKSCLKADFNRRIPDNDDATD